MGISQEPTGENLDYGSDNDPYDDDADPDEDHLPPQVHGVAIHGEPDDVVHGSSDGDESSSSPTPPGSASHAELTVHESIEVKVSRFDAAAQAFTELFSSFAYRNLMVEGTPRSLQEALQYAFNSRITTIKSKLLTASMRSLEAFPAILQLFLVASEFKRYGPVLDKKKLLSLLGSFYNFIAEFGALCHLSSQYVDQYFSKQFDFDALKVTLEDIKKAVAIVPEVVPAQPPLPVSPVAPVPLESKNPLPAPAVAKESSGQVSASPVSVSTEAAEGERGGGEEEESPSIRVGGFVSAVPASAMVAVLEEAPEARTHSVSADPYSGTGPAEPPPSDSPSIIVPLGDVELPVSSPGLEALPYESIPASSAEDFSQMELLPESGPRNSIPPKDLSSQTPRVTDEIVFTDIEAEALPPDAAFDLLLQSIYTTGKFVLTSEALKELVDFLAMKLVLDVDRALLLTELRRAACASVFLPHPMSRLGLTQMELCKHILLDAWKRTLVSNHDFDLFSLPTDEAIVSALTPSLLAAQQVAAPDSTPSLPLTAISAHAPTEVVVPPSTTVNPFAETQAISTYTLGQFIAASSGLSALTSLTASVPKSSPVPKSPLSPPPVDSDEMSFAPTVAVPPAPGHPATSAFLSSTPSVSEERVPTPLPASFSAVNFLKNSAEASGFVGSGALKNNGVREMAARALKNLQIFWKSVDNYLGSSSLFGVKLLEVRATRERVYQVLFFMGVGVGIATGAYHLVKSAGGESGSAETASTSPDVDGGATTPPDFPDVIQGSPLASGVGLAASVAPAPSVSSVTDSVEVPFESDVVSSVSAEVASSNIDLTNEKVRNALAFDIMETINGQLITKLSSSGLSEANIQNLELVLQEAVKEIRAGLENDAGVANSNAQDLRNLLSQPSTIIDTQTFHRIVSQTYYTGLNQWFHGSDESKLHTDFGLSSTDIDTIFNNL